MDNAFIVHLNLCVCSGGVGSDGVSVTGSSWSTPTPVRHQATHHHHGQYIVTTMCDILVQHSISNIKMLSIYHVTFKIIM